MLADAAETVVDQELEQPVWLADVRVEGGEEGTELAVRIEAADVSTWC